MAELRQNGAALKDHLSKKQTEANVLKGRVAALIAAEQAAAEAKRAAEERRLREKEEAEAKARERDMAAATAPKKAEPAKEETEKKGTSKAEKKQKTEKPKKETPKKEAPAKKELPKKGEPSKGDLARADNARSGDMAKNESYANARKRRPRTDNKNSNSGKESSPRQTTPPAQARGFASMRGSLPRPVSGQFQITSQFGRHSLPDLPDVMYDNPGIDARVSPGSRAQAVYEGKVSGVYMIPGYSTVVIVNHGEYYTVYGNLTAAAVKVGDTVKQGTALGAVALDEDDPSAGMIHFEVWKNREKQNPQSWIR